ncbi:unnamed protein product [Toxocara canis]|uniref:MARVEL domain-containing protein n=1 Tax=Toxocara canis TaxID=6265 RepID=A0A183TVU6_TOXCA|nr:unnamed protein product [Toxocara canis]
MARKGSKSNQVSPKEKSGKKFRSQFWSSQSKKEEEKALEEQPKRPESSVSRQFLPKKQQGVNEAWSKQSQESREEQNQPFNYTPFKSSTLNRPPSVNGVRGPTPIVGQTLLQSNTVQRQSGCIPRLQQSHQGQLKSQCIPQLNGNPYQIYGIVTNAKGMFLFIFSSELHPQGQSTPKMAPQHVIRQQEKAQLPAGPYRPASALNLPTVARPTSRANSDVGIGIIGGGMGSRYQSYCTLPRPEQIEYDQHSTYDSEISHMAQQINMLYGSYNAKPIGDIQPIYVQNQVNMNRPASQMLAGAPGMASDYINQQSSVYDVEPTMSPPETEEEALKTSKDIVYFDALSLLSVFQVLCAIVIFTCGVLRLIWHAKWALGIELAFAIFVFIAGTLGIYANSKRSHCAAIGSFVLSAFSALIALIPLVLGTLCCLNAKCIQRDRFKIFSGLFPTVPLTFPSADAELFVNEDESQIVDYLLSFACFAERWFHYGTLTRMRFQLVVALITAIYGCQSIGSTMTHVEKLRLNADLNAAFESSSASLPKSSDTTREKKAPVH